MSKNVKNPDHTEVDKKENLPHDWSLIKEHHKVDKRGVPYGLKDVNFFHYIRRSGRIGEIAPGLREKFTPEDLKAFGFANEMLAQAVFRNDDYAKALNVPEKMRKEVRKEKARAARDYGKEDEDRRKKNMAIYYADEKVRAKVFPLADISDLNVFINGTAVEKVLAFNRFYDKNTARILPEASKLGGRLSRFTPAVRRQVVMTMFFDLILQIYNEAQGISHG